MFCGKCGRELMVKQASYCGKCGNHVPYASWDEVNEVQYDKKIIKNGKELYIAGVVALLGIAVVISLFVIPMIKEKKATDYLTNGIEYVNRGEYESALKLFMNVLKYDSDCIEAKYYIMYSQDKLGNNAQVKEAYETAVVAISNLNSQEVDLNAEFIVKIYSMSEQIYGKDYKKLIQVYEDAVNKMPDIAELSKQLKTYFEAYLKLLVESNEFEKANQMVSKYENRINEVNFSSWKSEISKKQKLVEEKNSYMQKLQDYMKSKDYVALTQYLLKNDMDLITDDMKKAYIYSNSIVPENYNGIAVGIYQSECKTYYYIYYGNYKDGARNGNGVTYYLGDNDGCYATFDGSWKNDKPNGNGILYDYDSHSDILTTMKGNYTNGLQDGVFTGQIKGNGILLTTQWEAKAGIAEDLIDQYSFIDLSSIRKQGYIVYAVYTDYYYNFFASTIKKGGKIGAIGFGSLTH